ncbi:hypothetical protein ASPBRDRAFT_453481 [Aspergillus brasiliensis CBS 101740]|uniref:Uncharacterized protein n=1 Tax=Aspergillus brasiliensis (strain CBS 101740 / IMI 381727 / IBT 21946) TaxID=767769 RepID=A0A1L9USL8_ASPBC|nr:hypothetical protein ASPBRDRAFT_453481 [Aspergillus brasiliensis CBS 101740]
MSYILGCTSAPTSRRPVRSGILYRFRLTVAAARLGGLEYSRRVSAGYSTKLHTGQGSLIPD